MRLDLDRATGGASGGGSKPHPKGQPMNTAYPPPTFSAQNHAPGTPELFEAAGTASDGLMWPDLEQLVMKPKERACRREGIGGSDANIILSGDRERVLQLWREKRGEAQAADLSSTLPVMLGCWTEPFNRMWFENLTGQSVSLLGQVISCSTYDWRRCTLDGYICETQAIWEAKHTNAFAKPEEVLERYMPQLQHNMAVAKSERAVLSVIFGNHKYETFEVASDWLYQLDLLQAEEDFWKCLQTGREPAAASPPAPPKPVGVREVCLESHNLWAVAAADWLETKDAAKRHQAASSQIKELVEPDVARAFGHGIEAKRSKAGALSIRELVQ
ncbi:MAG TPA: YqaJ viral recombinase family protein [Sphingomicrobium sp.]|nr:YqaJ viral recombinase family protein [Sphingomicrobium sp.]